MHVNYFERRTLFKVLTFSWETNRQRHAVHTGSASLNLSQYQVVELYIVFVWLREINLLAFQRIAR